MKKVFICLLGIVFITLVVPVFAQENAPTSPSHGSVTYVKHHLNPDALPVWNLESIEELIEVDSNTPTLTLENGKIDEIDAYFESEVPGFTLRNIYYAQYNSPEAIEAFETKRVPEFTPNGTLRIKISEDLYDVAFDKKDDKESSPGDTIGVSWNIGDIAVALGYDGTREKNPSNHLLHDKHLIKGQFNMPLGESGFSLGAYLAMYAASDISVHKGLAEHPAPQKNQTSITESLGEADRIAQVAFAGNPAEQGEIVSVRPSTSQGTSSRNAVLGAVNFSGAVKGVDVFTEIGFASGTGELTRNTTAAGMDVANFYALGGAKYTLRRVTLGIEAGFENGDDPIDDLTSDFLGFENDLWSDNIIEDSIPGDELSHKLYAKVSARMNPTEKMIVEGAFSCIKPVEDGSGDIDYGFEVNGAFYYSLTNYVKYLVKAGVASLENASDDSQYEVINRLEFKF